MKPMQHLCEEELKTQLLEGSKEAFEELYNLFSPGLFLHAYAKVKDRELSKDLVQDLFAHLWEQPSRLNVQGELQTYLHVCMKNRIIDYISKEKNHSTYITTFYKYLPISSELTDHTLRENMFQEHIEKLLSTMPSRVQEVFILSRRKYLSHKEISQKLGISEHTVRGYIKDALRIFRAKLGVLLIGALAAASILFF